MTVEGKGGTRAIHRVVNSGGSFGANPLRQEIGLGDAARVTSVEILWPVTGKTQRIEGLKPNAFYRIREGDAAATPSRASRSASAAGERPRLDPALRGGIGERLVAALHAVIIVVGAPGYRYFGAGEEMARRTSGIA